MISPLNFAVAALPVAMYLIMLGLVCSRTKPLVTTGWRDTAALGLAVMGLVVIGPMQLFFPSNAAGLLAAWVWPMLLLLYLLSLLLVVLGCRPRIVVYGVSQETFCVVLLRAASQIDSQASWNGQVLELPTVGLQLAPEPTGTAIVQQAVSLNGLARIEIWLQVERELVRVCAGVRATHSKWYGRCLLIAGGLLAVAAVALIAQAPNVALNELQEFLVH